MFKQNFIVATLLLLVFFCQSLLAVSMPCAMASSGSMSGSVELANLSPQLGANHVKPHHQMSHDSLPQPVNSHHGMLQQLEPQSHMQANCCDAGSCDMVKCLSLASAISGYIASISVAQGAEQTSVYRSVYLSPSLVTLFRPPIAL